MGSKNKSPKLPDTPTFYRDPLVDQSNQFLYNTGSRLASGDFSGLGDIREAVSLNPDVTRLTLEGLQSSLAPSLRQSRQDVINQLEANGQLTGSTTASALGNIQSDYEARLVAAGAEAGIADINRALQNRMTLFGTGMNAVQAAQSGGLTQQSQVNQFNLDNYQNQVAKVLGEQKQNKGGLAGALTGGLAGAVQGFAMGGPVGAVAGGTIGAAGGYMAPSGTGGSLLNATAMMQGSKGGLWNTTPPSTVTSGNASPIWTGESINSNLLDPASSSYLSKWGY